MRTTSGWEPLDRVRTIKHLRAADQLAILKGLAAENGARSGEIRRRLEASGGVEIRLTMDDGKVMLLALASAVAHDIATLPDARLRQKCMLVHEEVVRLGGMGPEDAVYFREHFAKFADLIV